MLDIKYIPLRVPHLVALIFMAILSVPAHAEQECMLRSLGSSFGPFKSAGESCAHTPSYGSAVWQSFDGTEYKYKCSNLSLGTGNVTCDGSCKATEYFDQTLGDCVDSVEVPTCGTTTKNPISLATGYKILPEVDYVKAGQSDLDVSRYYLFDGESGRWSFGYQQKVRANAFNANETILYIGAYRENEVEYYFHADVVASSTQEAIADTKYAPFRLFVTFDATPKPSGYLIQMPDGSEEAYAYTGKLSELKARSGSTKTITYPTNSMLVVDSVSGLSLKYFYTSIISSKPKQVTKIELKNGSTILQTYNYAYNTTTALLEEVTYPDSSTIAYAYGESGAPATALTSKDENGTTYITWDYDGDGRANMSSLGSSGAEELNITYAVNSSTGLIEEAEVENASNQVKTLKFKSIGGVNKLAQVEGAAMGSCAPADSYTTYDEDNMSDTYRQKETVTEGVDLVASHEGVVTRYKHEDSHWPHLVTTRISGLTWDSGAVKPWSTSGTFDPDATDIQPESQKVVTAWHDDMAAPITIQYFGRNGSSWENDRTLSFTYDDGDGSSGTHNCDGNSGFNSYRVCSRVVTDVLASPDVSRTWSYAYTLHSTTKAVTGMVVTDPSSQVTTYSYTNGQLTSVVLPTTNSIAQTTTYAGHNAFGLPATITDPNGIVSALTYDNRGRVNTVTTNSNAVTDFDYYANGLLQKITQPDGSSLEYFYNSAHQLIGLENNHGDYMAYTPSILDGQWNVQEICTAGNATSGCTGDTVAKFERVFDALGRLSVIKDASNNPKQVFGYDSNNNLTTRTLLGDDANDPGYDDNDLATVHEYDALDRLIRSVGNFDCGGACSLDTYNNYDDTVPASPETQYAYNGQGLVSSVTDAEGHVTSFSYNGFGELTQEVSPDRGTTTYAYDAAGNLITKTDARSKVTQYQYDNLNRLTGIDYGYSSSFAADVSYTYDEIDSAHGKGAGRLTSVTDLSGSTDYKYDALGRLLQKTQQFTGLASAQVTAYAWEDNVLTHITYPGGAREVVLARNANRLDAMDVEVENTSRVDLVEVTGYQPFGGINSHVRLLENESTLEWARVINNNGLLTALSNTLVSGNPSSLGMDYEYDAFNNISSIADSNDPVASQQFVYDALQRLTQAAGMYGRYSYTYDDVGNRLTQQLQRAPANNPTAYSEVFTETYSYVSGKNRLTAIERLDANDDVLRDRRFTYDAAGNTLKDRNTVYIPGTTTVDTDWLRKPGYGDNNRMDSVVPVDCKTNPTHSDCL